MAVSGDIWTGLCDTAPTGEVDKQKLYGLKGSAADGVYIDHDGSQWRILDGSGVLIPARLPATVMHTDVVQTVTEPLTIDTGVDEQVFVVDATANDTEHAVHLQGAAGDKVFHISSAAPGAGSFCQFAIEGLGIHEWGAGGASPRDTRLQRSAANTLQVDDNAGGAATLNVIGEIQQDGDAVALARLLPNRNLLINGGFGIWQRQNDPDTLTTYDDDAYGPDRWYLLSSQASALQAQRIDGSEQRYALRLKQNSATATQPGLAQIIEGVNCRHLRGKTVTLRLRVRCSAAGNTLKVGLLEWSGTEDDLKTSSSHDFVSVWAGTPTLVTNMALPSGASYGSVTSAADTWQEMVYTATLGTSFNNLVVFLFSGDTLAQNTTLDVESVQVEAGPLPTPFEQRSAAFEDALCKRYFEREVGSGYYYFAAGFVGATNLAFFAYRYAPKRTVPTFNTSALATIGVIGGTTVRTASSIAFQFATERGCRIQVGATLTAPAATAVFCNNTTAYFEADAEL